LAKIEASDSVIFGISIDSMPANAAFAKQIGVTFPLLSDMNRKVLTAYGILQKYPVGGDSYEFARRTTFVIDKNGTIKHIDFDSTAIDPTSAVTICTDLNEKHGK
jgi:thioredoxin-dependent peroxiredoxin